jgi:polar amino acid transport system substrate-binding protein
MKLGKRRFRIEVAASAWLSVCACSPAPASKPSLDAPKSAPSVAPQAPKSDGEVLEIGAEDDAAPWSQADGSGYANELVLAAFAAAGVKVHLQVLPYARCKQMVMDGVIPACFSMSRSPEVSSSVEFASEPLFVCHTNYVETAARAVAAPKTPRVVGAVLGYEYPDSLHARVKSGELVLEESVSEELNLKKLADGRIDAALVNTNETKPLDTMIAKAGPMKVETAVLEGELDSYLGFSRKHPRGPSARAQFDEGFRRIAEDGTKQRITAAWIARARAARAPLQAGVPDR